MYSHLENKTKTRKRGLFIILLAILIVIPFISAQPPFEENILSQEGLQIYYPQFEYIQQNSDFYLHIHVSNISNGFPLENTVADCYLHLYDINGSHTFESGIMDKDSNGWDHMLYISEGNFSSLGTHAFFIWCNDSTANLGGEVRGTFEVTKDGTSSMENKSGIFIGVGIFIALVFAIGRVISRSKWKLKMFFDLIALLSGIILLNLINKIYGQITSIYNMGQILVVIGIILSSVFFLYYFVNWTIELIGYFKKKKEKKWSPNPY